MMLAQTALAQSWLPWTTREEPRRQPPPQPQPQAPPNFGQFRQPYNGNPQAYGNPQAFGNKPPICLQLEQRLAQDAHRQANSAGTIQKLRESYNAELQKQRRLERELDQRECYESFLFTRSLRPSRICRQLDQDARVAGRRVEELSLEIRQFQSGGNREQQDEIIRALARNNCGSDYQREASRRGGPISSFWQDSESDGARGPGNTFGGLPFATYRTVCVRLCDGYYFPVSFSTLPAHFARDTDVCQSKCAAPTELFFHQNPGGSIEQMVSQRNQQPYKSLRTAFRYRKEYVSGCSCKESEYVPDSGTVPLAQAPAGKNEGSKLSPMR